MGNTESSDEREVTEDERRRRNQGQDQNQDWAGTAAAVIGGAFVAGAAYAGYRAMSSESPSRGNARPSPEQMTPSTRNNSNADESWTSGSSEGGYPGVARSYDNNRANQCNPNHVPTGPGRSAGYHGAGTKEDLNNHSNQLNPNNKLYRR